MRKLATAGAIAVVVAVGAVMLVPTQATGAKERTLKFSAKYADLQQFEVDADDSGELGPGDYFVGGFVLRRGGRVRGHLEFHCDIVTAQPERELCHAVAHVDGFGELVLDDVSNANRFTEKAAITGGTGRFGGASGNAFLDFRKAKRAYFTFNVK